VSNLPHRKVLHKSSVFSRWQVPASTTTCIIDIHKNTTIPLTQMYVFLISLLFFFWCHSLSYLSLFETTFSEQEQ